MIKSCSRFFDGFWLKGLLQLKLEIAFDFHRFNFHTSWSSLYYTAVTKPSCQWWAQTFRHSMFMTLGHKHSILIIACLHSPLAKVSFNSIAIFSLAVVFLQLISITLLWLYLKDWLYKAMFSPLFEWTLAPTN